MCLLQLVAAFLWTYVLAAFCDIAANSNPALVAFRQRLDALNLLVKMNALPKTLSRRMRAYMHQQKDVMLREDAMESLPLLSSALQIEATLKIHSLWMGSVWFVRDLEPAVKVCIAQALTPRVLAPGELAPIRHLYVVRT